MLQHNYWQECFVMLSCFYATASENQTRRMMKVSLNGQENRLAVILF